MPTASNSSSPVHRPASPLPDVAIIGAGIIGCALACELARRGARVALLDRGEPGAEASSAAAGMLGPQAECDGPSPLLALGLASRARYPQVVAALHEETGIDAEYQDDGIVYVALDDAEEARLVGRARWQAAAGLAVERLTAEDVCRLEPALAATVRSAIRFPHDHRLDNVRLTRAYAVACSRLGVELRSGVTATKIQLTNGRATGVRTHAGAVAAGAVVVAAGAWTSGLVPATSPVPIRPIRGQMVGLRGPVPLVRHAVYSHGVYLVPRRDGRLLAGSTYEDVGFDKRVTGGAIGGILGRALALLPALATATLATTWAGLRPGTPDHLPILGRAPEVEGLYYATGHYRNGILLAPITAHALAGLILDDHTDVDLTGCSPTRFAPAAGVGEP